MAFATIVQQRAAALIVSDDPFFGGTGREHIVGLAARYAIPTSYRPSTKQPLARGLTSSVACAAAVIAVAAMIAKIIARVFISVSSPDHVHAIDVQAAHLVGHVSRYVSRHVVLRAARDDAEGPPAPTVSRKQSSVKNAAWPI